MRSLRIFAVALVAASSALAVACSSSSPHGTTGQGDGGGGGGDIDGGVSLVTDTSKITASQSNGFDGPGPDGSTCGFSTESFTYDVATKTLTWSLCETDAGIQVLTPGSRVLTDDEATSFRATLDNVSVDTTPEDTCATDQPSQTLTIDERTYHDQLQHCSDDGNLYADGVAQVLSDANDLARK